MKYILIIMVIAAAAATIGIYLKMDPIGHFAPKVPESGIVRGSI